MELKVKNFILDNLLDVIKTLNNFFDELNEEGKLEISEEMYNVHLKYARRVLEIILKNNLPNEYELIINEIELVDSQKGENLGKLMDINGKLINFGIKIIDKY